MSSFAVKFDEDFSKRVHLFVKKYPNLTDKTVRSAAVFANKRITKDTPADTGRAKRSWNIRKIRNAIYMIINSVSPYPAYLEEGTGRFGPKNRDIKPKKGKYLRFPIIKGNTIVKWVTTPSVKGIKPVRMIGKNIPLTLKKLQLEFKKNIRIAWNKI